ncbi:MAG: hypothetical protein M3O70_04255 [Actinomycetota bacterium]|nr:hypothetical protein [Actinomycetota bacterium]
MLPHCAAPVLDVRWENHAAHFLLVFAAAAINAALGFRIDDGSSAVGRNATPAAHVEEEKPHP